MPSNVDQLTLAVVLCRDGRWAEALQCASEVLSVGASTELEHVALGLIAMSHVELGNTDAGCFAVTACLELGIDSAVSAALKLSHVLSSDGDVVRATEILVTAHHAFPRDIEVLTSLANLASSRGAYPSAIEWLELLNRINPANALSRDEFLTGLKATVDKNNRTVEELGRIGAAVSAVTDFRVVSGPFSGMWMSSSHDFAWVATLLGCYEMELHRHIEDVISAKPNRIVNIGCSAGYYAVGFALRLPQAQILAYDTEPEAQEMCRSAARANGVDGQVVVGGALAPHVLNSLIVPGTVIFCDCEGYELILLDPLQVPALEAATIIVELHDVWVPNLSYRVLERFLATHEITRIAAIPRSPTMYPFLDQLPLSARDKVLAVSDFRDLSMTWAYMRPRSRESATVD